MGEIPNYVWLIILALGQAVLILVRIIEKINNKKNNPGNLSKFIGKVETFMEFQEKLNDKTEKALKELDDRIDKLEKGRE